MLGNFLDNCPKKSKVKIGNSLSILALLFLALGASQVLAGSLGNSLLYNGGNYYNFQMDIFKIDNNAHLTSSVMWQSILKPDSGVQKYIYPPGVFGVLAAKGTDRQFTIEQYFSAEIDESDFRVHIDGPWAADKNPADFVTRRGPTCKSVGTLGFKCETIFTVGYQVPSGIIGLSIGFMLEDREVTHPASVFQIIIPDQGYAQAVNKDPGPSEDIRDRGENLGRLAFTLRDLVVRIASGDSYATGTGFITRDVESLLSFFPPKMRDKIAAIEEKQRIFVVTVGHLFPLHYQSASPSNDEIGFFSSPQGIYKSAYVFDLYIHGKLFKESAALLGRNMEADIALLYLTEDAVDKYVQEFGLKTPQDIKGIEFEEVPVDSGVAYAVLGFPAKDGGALVERPGFLPLKGLSTEDTSNFGSMQKFKLESVTPKEELAEAGMSGSPILNNDGRVVGMAIEKPNDTNSLVALDFSNLKAEQVRKASSLTCQIQFDPFSRLLWIINEEPDCNYGRFGSLEVFEPLTGKWKIQEILGFADEVRAKPMSSVIAGNSVISGHSIIVGGTIISGHSIIKSEYNNQTLIVDGRKIKEFNEKLADGLALNPDSFKAFEPKGARILDMPNDAFIHMAQKPQIGSLIRGMVRKSGSSEFTGIYSIRDFVIWLHQAASPDRTLDPVVCFGDTQTPACPW